MKKWSTPQVYSFNEIRQNTNARESRRCKIPDYIIYEGDEYGSNLHNRSSASWDNYLNLYYLLLSDSFDQ